MDEMIRDVLLDGIADIDIRREALSVEGMQSKSVNDIIGFVESRESANHRCCHHIGDLISKTPTNSL